MLAGCVVYLKREAELCRSTLQEFPLSVFVMMVGYELPVCLCSLTGVSCRSVVRWCLLTGVGILESLHVHSLPEAVYSTVRFPKVFFVFPDFFLTCATHSDGGQLMYHLYS